jgi:predicted metal-dependent phosphoesterase TrpH
VIDLQLHTTDSDGTWPWDKVLEACLAMGLKAFAITDHDTTLRRDEIRAWAKQKKAPAIAGIELSTSENDQTVHLLGYFLEGPLETLEKRLEYLREGRKARNEKIINKLRSLGIDITVDEVIQRSGRGTMGRPHIARLLMEKKAVGSMQEAFEKYLTPSGLAYFPKDELPLREGIDLLREAGAVTSVAHPGLLKRSFEELETSLGTWRSWGLDGIEAIYPSYNDQQAAFFNRMAFKYGFLMTGGSDFHGENKPHIKIGTGMGNLNVPDILLEPLLKRRDDILHELNRTQQKV